MQNPPWLVRIIEEFSNDTEELVGEFDLPPIELVELQKLWGALPDEPMIECFEIGEAEAHFFRELVGIEFDFAQSSYFLSAYTTDLNAARTDGGYMGAFPPPRDLPAFPAARLVMPKSPSD